MQKKSGITKSGLDAMPLFLQDDLLNVQMQLHTGVGPIANDLLPGDQVCVAPNGLVCVALCQ